MALNQHQQIYETIQKSQKPLIVFGERPSGDSISSSLALAALLSKLGKKSKIVSPNFSLPHNYLFLTEKNKIQNNLSALRKMIITLEKDEHDQPEIKSTLNGRQMEIHITPQKNISKENIRINDSYYLHDLVITINTPDLESLKHLYEENNEFFYQVPIINIDHLAENEHYGHLNAINLTSSSIAEIIYDFIESIDLNLLDEKIATYLLTGMIEKTKSFKNPNVTPKSLNIASHLMAAGAKREEIIRNLYQKQTIGALKLWGRILMNLKTDSQQKIAWAVINKEDFQQTNARPEDILGAINELIVSIPSVELTTIFYEHDNSKKALIKTEKEHNLKNIFQEFRPNGEKQIITFELNTNHQYILDKLNQLI